MRIYIMFHILLSFIMAPNLSTPKLPFNETGTEIRLQITPDHNYIDTSGNILLTTIAENTTTQSIQNVDFALTDPQLLLQSIDPLPSEIISKTAAVGRYSVTIKPDEAYTLIGKLRYSLRNQQRIAIAKTDLSLQYSPWINRDISLLILGAILSLLGGFFADIGKIWLTRQRQAVEQADKALGILIPTLTICMLAVEQNRKAPIDLWDEVYFKEGLHSALVERALRIGKPEITINIAQLYAKLRGYNNNPQLGSWETLKSELIDLQNDLQQL